MVKNAPAGLCKPAGAIFLPLFDIAFQIQINTGGPAQHFRHLVLIVYFDGSFGYIVFFPESSGFFKDLFDRAHILGCDTDCVFGITIVIQSMYNDVVQRCPAIGVISLEFNFAFNGLTNCQTVFHFDQRKQFYCGSCLLRSRDSCPQRIEGGTGEDRAEGIFYKIVIAESFSVKHGGTDFFFTPVSAFLPECFFTVAQFFSEESLLPSKT